MTKTFKSARDELIRHLDVKGWRISPPLKVQHATSPDGRLRLWFKPQAVYYTVDEHKFSYARSVHCDIRLYSSPAECLKSITSFVDV